MKVAFPSYDVQTLNGRAGGVGAFITHFARLLTEQGEEVSIIKTRGETHGVYLDRRWRDNYRAWGIDLIEVNNSAPSSSRWPEVWPMRLSEQVAPIIRDFDVVYFSDWANTAFHTVRRKRFSRDPTPVCVTVIHGPSNWIRLADRRLPNIPDDLNLEFLERYSARHSDFVIAPSRHILDWTKSEGWRFRCEPVVLGLPFRPEPDGMQTEEQRAAELKRLVFFGRLEPRKGYDLFVDALRHLRTRSPEVVQRLDEVVLMGHEDVPGSAEWVRRELNPLNVRVTHLGGLDNLQARDYLAEHVADTLVVVPSRFENFPMVVMEASLIPGLNLICTRGGGTAEILGEGADAQLFNPLPDALAAKIHEVLDRPFAPDELGRYDYEAANERWLAFHSRACRRARAAHPTSRVSLQSSPASLDVCITYYNKAAYFPQLLESLERQTWQNFGVVAVDDGSPDPDARGVFDALGERYKSRGWTFFRQSNSWVDAARNATARRSHADYLMFVDADDVLAREAVERMLDAVIRSGIDCVTVGSFLFAGDELPYDPETGEITASPIAHYMPLGPSVVAGLLDPAVFGGPVIVIRREVFEAIGGYRELRGVTHEDWELHARLNMAGYETDVVPEYLHYYRQLEDGLSHNPPEEFSRMGRLLESYDRHLAPVNMYGAARAMYALYRDTRVLERRVQDLERQIISRPARFQTFGLPSTDWRVGLFGDQNYGPPPVRVLRRIYRRVLPPETRLRLNERLMKLAGIKTTP